MTKSYCSPKMNMVLYCSLEHIYLDAYNFHGYAVSKFLPKSGFEWISPKEFDLNKYTSNNSKVVYSKMIIL